MVLFGGIQQMIGGLIPSGAPAGSIRTLTATDFLMPDVNSPAGGSIGSITAAPAKWVRVGTYTIEAQSRYNIGTGKAGVTDSNQGILFATFSSEYADVHGYMRMYFANNENRVKLPYLLNKLSTRRTNKDLSDGKDKVYFVPLNGSVVGGEDDYIVIEYMPEGSSSQTIDGVTLRLDFTKTEIPAR